MMQEIIKNKLAVLEPVFIGVVNESDQHNVPAGSESHFKVVIASSHFEGQRLLARHRIIYQLLEQEMQQPIHALALHTYTPDEWQKQQDSVPDSPECRGGSRFS
ncbi:BolA/IbaG family iron-sulfur metabolism protein [Jinshanibacter sp. LJY008]|uniref:DNA-binding transcriptional regulator BolA n=1 Tax=Limnobaculum eriocheiris TaxID=2897391 RepID=A0A9X1MS15_9GAMM|nr:BolA/IbaG family iron-sulfur metabolism protein [Limnobaculum eriocheiris]MCD1124486.1 BolA/IbaG family iron-sulfur metabolism protein [Limnobaculum eriocheiris]